ncbi:TetR family transcriptional regulator [Nonomuraea typhae]|uniref:TetR family transcriptional regulator n=1 Tax=Nonomuraea typhae TaxID=2603600 RepID=A0ABW7Z3Q3_9ACTN
MARNAEVTRRKILDAASEEFARHGIAGARVDRITRAAGVNNALLYRYFGSKLALFDTVYRHLLFELVDAVPFDAYDLPGYVGRLYDFYEERPHVVRLTAWWRLERPEHEIPKDVFAAHRAKVAMIEQAQRDGAITSTLPAAELCELMLLLSLSHSPLAPAMGDVSREVRRATSVAAAEAVLRSG